MISIFSNMVEDTIEVFMDDFSVVGDSFERCLTNLSERGYCVGSLHFRKGHRG